MMEEKEIKYREIELRSEEVQEVMSHVPSWILRWGITVLFAIVIVLLIGCYLFKYPDIVEAEITISTRTPPVYVVAKVSGRLNELYVANGTEITEETLIGVIENAARTEDMLLVKKKLEEWKQKSYLLSEGERLVDSKYLQLGEVQATYASLISVLNDYANFLKQDYYSQKLSSKNKLLNSRKEYYQLAKKQYLLESQGQKLAKRIYERDSILYTRKVMSPAEYDDAKRSYLQQRQNHGGIRMSLSQIDMQIEQGRETLLDIRHQALTEEQKYVVNLKNAIEQFQVSIASWEQHYLLIAPISGRLNYMSVWSRNQNVNSNESLFVIAPKESSPPIGKALLPVLGSGKVRVGQLVNIRLNNYPDQEFGYVKGEVASVSPVPTAELMYIVDVKLSEGLRTSYNKELPMTRELKGTAEIITEDLRLIERLLMPLKKLWNSGW